MSVGLHPKLSAEGVPASQKYVMQPGAIFPSVGYKKPIHQTIVQVISTILESIGVVCSLLATICTGDYLYPRVARHFLPLSPS